MVDCRHPCTFVLGVPTSSQLWVAGITLPPLYSWPIDSLLCLTMGHGSCLMDAMLSPIPSLPYDHG